LLKPAAKITEIRGIGNFPLAVLASHRSVSFQRGKNREDRLPGLRINILQA
jgi:hypothetical protein